MDDLGARTFDPIDDYPAYMHSLALQVSRDSGAMGIAFGGSGQGEAIVLNRQPGPPHHAPLQTRRLVLPVQELVSYIKKYSNSTLYHIYLP